jgi:hypothetical protein
MPLTIPPLSDHHLSPSNVGVAADSSLWANFFYPTFLWYTAGKQAGQLPTYPLPKHLYRMLLNVLNGKRINANL